MKRGSGFSILARGFDDDSSELPFWGDVHGTGNLLDPPAPGCDCGGARRDCARSSACGGLELGGGFETLVVEGLWPWLKTTGNFQSGVGEFTTHFSRF